MANFPTELEAIEARIQKINPESYASTRNYKNGAVTFLSPYISRGVISTREVYEHLKKTNLPWYKIEKLIQELAWRDYWQRVWIEKKDGIFQDLKHTQSPVSNHEIPIAILEAKTGIDAIDKGILELYSTGYMHNHMRMYVASLCCNIAHCHWLEPAKWLYSHLLDGDLASNHLSWQWVGGANANKKYFANQENINTFFESNQKGTFLDVDYEAFADFKTPEILKSTQIFSEITELPNVQTPTLDPQKKTLVYNYYNLDPHWYSEKDVQRVFLLEPSFFKTYPISKKSLDFSLALSQNIANLTIFVGEFDELKSKVENLVYKEHPTNSHYSGKEEPRDWLSSVEGYYPSFFGFWKKCKKEL